MTLTNNTLQELSKFYECTIILNNGTQFKNVAIKNIEKDEIEINSEQYLGYINKDQISAIFVDVNNFGNVQ